MSDVVHNFDRFLNTLRSDKGCDFRIRVGVNVASFSVFASYSDISSVEMLGEPVALHGRFESNKASVDDSENNQENTCPCKATRG
jgi:hypothetical protein